MSLLHQGWVWFRAPCVNHTLASGAASPSQQGEVVTNWGPSGRLTGRCAQQDPWAPSAASLGHWPWLPRWGGGD